MSDLSAYIAEIVQRVLDPLLQEVQQPIIDSVKALANQIPASPSYAILGSQLLRSTSTPTQGEEEQKVDTKQLDKEDGLKLKTERPIESVKDDSELSSTLTPSFSPKIPASNEMSDTKFESSQSNQNLSGAINEKVDGQEHDVKEDEEHDVKEDEDIAHEKDGTEDSLKIVNSEVKEGF